MNQEDRYLTDVEAGKLLSASPQTLRNWRCVGRGPAYSKQGRMVRYSLRDLMKFMEAGRINPEGPRESE